jgi:hypothetical protein
VNWIKGWPTWVKWVVGVFVVLLIVGAIFGEDEEKDGGSTTSSTVSQGSANAGGGNSTSSSKQDSEASDDSSQAVANDEEDEGCGTEATDDCTPHVGAKGSVKVDGLVWKLKNVKTASAIGDQAYGLGEEANGIYIVADLSVTSTKDESVTITEEAINLVAEEGNTYSTDSDGTFAAIGEGQEAFLFEDIGPNSTLEGVVVFDVPQSLLKAKLLELEFGELGFGDTHGYIALPKLN